MRFRVLAAWQGAIRTVREVSVEQHTSGEVVALSTAPATVDEELALDVTSGAGTAGYLVKVLDSRPVIVDGALRHRLRLQLLDQA